MPAHRNSLRFLLTLMLAGTLLVALPFHLHPDNFTVDDGYFYPQIARFIVRGEGSTFNGITPTNGYHPLWMFVCVGAAWITPASSSLIQLLGTIQDLLIFGSVALLISIARRASMHGALLGCMPILFISMVLGIWRLLEANLALVLQITTLIVLVPVLPEFYDRIRRLRNPLLGILLGLVMLTRLDLIFFVLTVLIFELFRKESARTTKEIITGVLIQSSIAAMLLIPYLAWNWWSFHRLLPISGAIKSTFPHVQHWGIAFFMYPAVIGIVLNGCLLLKRTRTSFDMISLVTSAAAALHMAYTISFGGITAWYLTTGYLAFTFTIIWVTDCLLRKAPGFAWVELPLVSVFLLSFVVIAALRLFSNFTYTHFVNGSVSLDLSYIESRRAFAEVLKKTLQPESNIMVFDAPGSVAFYSGMRIIPVDGLVSDYAYNIELVRDGLPAYLARKHIDYFVAPYLRNNQTYNRLFLREMRTVAGQMMEVRAPLTGQIAGHILLPDADLVFCFREINPDLELNYPQVAVWRVRH